MPFLFEAATDLASLPGRVKSHSYCAPFGCAPDQRITRRLEGNTGSVYTPVMHHKGSTIKTNLFLTGQLCHNGTANKKILGTLLFIFYLILLSLADHFLLSHKFTKFSRIKNQPNRFNLTIFNCKELGRFNHTRRAHRVAIIEQSGATFRKEALN